MIWLPYRYGYRYRYGYGYDSHCTVQWYRTVCFYNWYKSHTFDINENRLMFEYWGTSTDTCTSTGTGTGTGTCTGMCTRYVYGVRVQGTGYPIKKLKNPSIWTASHYKYNSLRHI